MKRSQLIRIACLLIVIFGAGIVTGRLTAPGPPTQVLNSRGRTMTAETVLARFTAEIGLDAGQRARCRPIFEEMAEKMAPLLPGTKERLDVFLSYVPRLREQLRPEQHAAFDRYAKETRQNFERKIRRRSGTQ